MAEKKKPNKRIAALGDAEPEQVFERMFRRADEKVNPKLRRSKQDKTRQGKKKRGDAR